jgi:hypothetical protein
MDGWMAVPTREVKEGLIEQGVDERVAYKIDTTVWGQNPTNVLVQVLDVTNGHLDVTDDVTTGSVSVVGNEVRLPLIHSLTLDHLYRVEVQFESDGQVFEPYIRLIATR